ncbi:hypothetical protein QA612_11225 [Evansella sp. AB-P1]|uniref:hypothetical protein n=1 Tax=Evansella sp. AB-P1 TaxID=3037653 RepID=UPI00241F3F77|nr:hypothetical protein [Evansella sp. AB-P1]MDG5788062.1 hypothetical protein [Evansella sp. AB-P1]
MTIKKSFIAFLLVILPLIFLLGCGVADGGKVTARDVLNRNSDADVFQYNGMMYNNVTELEWFQERKEEYTKHGLIGEIKNQSTNWLFFRDYTATKLPVGTKIYFTSENEIDVGILSVELEGETLYYMQLLQG